MKAIEIVRPGEKYREIGNVIQKHAQAHGLSVVRSYCGHGIHRLFHTAPNVPHYASKLKNNFFDTPNGIYNLIAHKGLFSIYNNIN